jgi:hypothetical protein
MPAKNTSMQGLHADGRFRGFGTTLLGRGNSKREHTTGRVGRTLLLRATRALSVDGFRDASNAPREEDLVRLDRALRLASQHQSRQSADARSCLS